MRLSEAIRLGAMLRPQAFYQNFANDGSCAMGAALEATGSRAERYTGHGVSLSSTALARWPWAAAAKMRCPLGCGKWRKEDREPVTRETVLCVIAHLNDTHSLTREQIADWVATVEPVETPEGTPVAVEVQVA